MAFEGMTSAQLACSGRAMVRGLSITLLLASVMATGCNGNHDVSTSVHISNGKTEAELFGEGAKATVAGDELEIKNGTLFLNKVSYGAIPASGRVRYLVLPSGRSLSVNGTQRHPVVH